MPIKRLGRFPNRDTMRKACYRESTRSKRYVLFPIRPTCSFVPILIYPSYLNPINGLQLIFSTNIISQGKSIHTCTFQRKERSIKRASTRLNTVSIRRTERSE